MYFGHGCLAGRMSSAVCSWLARKCLVVEAWVWHQPVEIFASKGFPAVTAII